MWYMGRCGHEKAATNKQNQANKAKKDNTYRTEHYEPILLLLLLSQRSSPARAPGFQISHLHGCSFHKGHVMSEYSHNKHLHKGHLCLNDTKTTLF